MAQAAKRPRASVPPVERAPWQIMSDVVSLGGFHPSLAEAA
jgi:hypothetical protein